jgi:hypothetical protein
VNGALNVERHGESVREGSERLFGGGGNGQRAASALFRSVCIKTDCGHAYREQRESANLQRALEVVADEKGAGEDDCLDDAGS